MVNPSVNITINLYTIAIAHVLLSSWISKSVERHSENDT